jgi:hypothetical protein
MVTSSDQANASVGANEAAPRLTTEQVWRQINKASFLVLSHVTPAGEPRSSGVIYQSLDRRLYVAVAPDSWKAKHIAANPRVAVTVPVHRGGILALVAPIPPATINFHSTAIVHPAGSMEIPKELSSLVPAERSSSACIIELVPEGAFLTYGVGVSLMKMRNPAASRARVPVLDNNAAG